MTEHETMAPAPKEPRLYGVIDVLRSDRVAGWVIDRTDPARNTTVEVLREGQVVGTVVANRPRKDLERQAVGTGAYGFVFSFDPPLEEGMEFTVSVVARSHDGVMLPLQQAARAAASVSPESRALGRVLAELAGLRSDVANLRHDLTTSEEGRARFQERLELVQLRLESGISAVDVPQGGTPRWLAGVAVSGATIALGSLAIGFLSLWGA